MNANQMKSDSSRLRLLPNLRAVNSRRTARDRGQEQARRHETLPLGTIGGDMVCRLDNDAVQAGRWPEVTHAGRALKTCSADSNLTAFGVGCGLALRNGHGSPAVDSFRIQHGRLNEV